MAPGSESPLQLRSNGFELSNDPQRLGHLVESDPAEAMGTLRERFRSHGYLWFRGFLPRERVLEMRERFFSTLSGSGLLAPGTDPRDGIDSGDPVAQREVRRALMEFVRSAAFESFCLQEKLWRFYDAFLEGPSYLHKRKIARYTRPGDPAATAAHYDLVYLRAGTDRVCSSWIPLGDIPVEMGGLVYLENSDSVGRELEAEFAAANAELPPEERISAFNENMTEGGWVTKNLPDMAERFDSRWLWADYEAGDMVVHSSYMVHAATENRDPERRLRFSTDIRYQNVRDAIDARWSEHWSLDDML